MTVLPVFFAAPLLPMAALIAINCLYGLAYGASSFLNRAMMADVCDYDELHTGQVRTGLYFSLLTMTGKLGYSAAVGVTYLTLGLIGFSSAPGTLNAPEALNGLAAVFIGFPVAAMLLAALVVRRFPLDQKAQEELRRAIAAHRMGELDAAAAAADISGGLGEIRPGIAKETPAQ
jgi:GPH family glycoside/pentoside/hexuronide:cation symporter